MFDKNSKSKGNMNSKPKEPAKAANLKVETVYYDAPVCFPFMYLTLVALEKFLTSASDLVL